jgi:hypothetical protein
MFTIPTLVIFKTDNIITCWVQKCCFDQFTLIYYLSIGRVVLLRVKLIK